MKEIRTVRQAIPRLGLKETMNVVMAIAHKSLYETTNAHYRFLMDKLWAHALATAFAAKLIGQHLRLPEVDVLFLMGLTHDIGKTFLLKAFSEEEAVKGMDMKLVAGQHPGGAPRPELRHAQALGLQRRLHPGRFAAREKRVRRRRSPKDCLVINLANMLTRTIGYSLLEGAVPAEIRSAQVLGIAPPDLQKIGEDTLGLVKGLAHLF